MPAQDSISCDLQRTFFSCSIGQVYKCRLKVNGDEVALKIQRPNCEEIIALDLYILRWWSGIYSEIFRILNRDINVQSIIDDFGELIYREVRKYEKNVLWGIKELIGFGYYLVVGEIGIILCISLYREFTSLLTRSFVHLSAIKNLGRTDRLPSRSRQLSAIH